MYLINKEMRTFITNNYITIKNGFINDSLIANEIDTRAFDGYLHLEKYYFEALKRNIANRTLSFEVFIST